MGYPYTCQKVLACHQEYPQDYSAIVPQGLKRCKRFLDENWGHPFASSCQGANCSCAICMGGCLTLPLGSSGWRESLFTFPDDSRSPLPDLSCAERVQRLR